MLTAMPLGLGSNLGKDKDICKCIVPSRHGGTLNSRRAASPLVRFVAGKERWKAPNHLEDYFPQNRDAPIISLALGASISLSNIKEGSDVYLECNIRANPWVSEVTWQFEDHYVSSNKSAGVIISNQTLVLQSVRREHRGRYRCLAGNSEGQSVSDYLHLLVQYAPVCKQSDPKVYGVARTEIVNVTCEVEADPPDVNFRWALNNSLEVVNLQKWWSEGSRSVLSYTPRTKVGYGLLLCWGSNVIGGQREPCVARIIPADLAWVPPNVVIVMVVVNEMLNILCFFCSKPDGHGYELVSSVRALVPQKFSVEEELMHVKHVEVKSPHVGVMWKFGRGVISSGIVLVT
ncbi:uncharacterized protein TNCV_2096371 [Trichonephila clavipes]|nr:uncharacterized protein TNCV_2096371 [Trichonephila clavipes]